MPSAPAIVPLRDSTPGSDKLTTRTASAAHAAATVPKAGPVP